MNNLIMAVIAITFAAVIMTAGVSYLMPVHTVLNTEATNTVAQIEEMVADYQTLQMNVGRAPHPEDYVSVYKDGQTTADGYQELHTQNATYKNVGTAASPTIERDFTIGSTGHSAPAAWQFIKGCGGMTDADGNPVDCFKMTIDPSTQSVADAQTTCQVLQMVKKRQQSSGAFAFDIPPNASCN